jgi:hypothetical protein
MNRIQSILVVTAAAFSVNMAHAQTSEGDNGNTVTETHVVTTTTDPLIQKREDNAQANAQYKTHKKVYKQQYKDSKDEYKQRLAGAKLDQKQFKQDATKQEKSSLSADAPAAPLAPASTKP